MQRVVADVHVRHAGLVVVPVRTRARARAAFEENFKGEGVEAQPAEVKGAWGAAGDWVGDDGDAAAAVAADAAGEEAFHEVAPAFFAAAAAAAVTTTTSHKHRRRQLQRIFAVLQIRQIWRQSQLMGQPGTAKGNKGVSETGVSKEVSVNCRFCAQMLAAGGLRTGSWRKRQEAAKRRENYTQHSTTKQTSQNPNLQTLNSQPPTCSRDR